MNSARWRFKNQRDGMVILVQDQQSAQNLASLLKRDRHGQWEILEEEVAGAEPVELASPVAAPPAPQPVVAETGTLSRSFSPRPSPPSAPEAHPAPVPPAPPARHEDTRRHKRFKRRFRVLLISENRTFRTYSSNISLGGMRLEKSIPAALVGAACRVLIGRMDNKENIEIHCDLLGDQSEPDRMKFVGLTPQSLQILEQWIAENSDTRAA